MVAGSAASPAPSSTKAYLQIHFCVVLWGFTAILGKAISLSAFSLVWWRMLLVAGALLLWPPVLRSLRAMPLRLIGTYAGIGVLVALHWLTFYAAIKLSNASVAATCIAAGPIFLALIEPLLHRRRPVMTDLALGIIAVPGVALVVGAVPSGMLVGIVVGIISAAFVAVFGALNKQFVHHGDPLTVTAIELGAGTLALTLLAPLVPLLLPGHSGNLFVLPGLMDAGLLATLAFACTLLPFALSLVVLRQLSAFSVQLAVNLEPVYAIALAMLLFGEHQEVGALFYLGVAIVVGAVFVHPWLSGRKTEAEAPENLGVAEAKSID